MYCTSTHTINKVDLLYKTITHTINIAYVLYYRRMTVHPIPQYQHSTQHAHLLHGGVHPAVSNVVKHRVVEHDGVLRYHSDGASDALLRSRLNVVPVQQDLRIDFCITAVC